MDWKRIEPWEYIVVNVASKYARMFDMCELEDIKQVLYEWFISHPNKLDNWEALGTKDAKNLIYRSLRNEALDYCQGWKAKTLGYEKGDLFYYTPEVVERLLSSILRKDEPAMPLVNLDNPGGGSGTPAESGNLAVMLAEVAGGYERLKEDDKKILFMRFGLSYELGEITSSLSLGSEDAVRMRLKRAIKHIITRIGGYKPRLEDDDESPPEKGSTISEEETPSEL